MPYKTFHIEIFGLHENDGRIRLDDFAGQLDDIINAIGHKERLISGHDRRAVIFDVVDIVRNNPFKVNVQASVEESVDDLPALLVDGFLSDIDAIQKGNTPEGIDIPALEAYKRMGSRVGNSFEQMVIASDDYSCVINSGFIHRIEIVEGPDYKVYGSVVGRIESANAHGSIREFRLFPQVGPARIVCRFPSKLVDEVGRAFYKRTTVTGWLRFKRGAMHPHAINVDSLYIHRDPNELPTLTDLRGIAPDITGGMRSEDFIRANRDAEQ